MKATLPDTRVTPETAGADSLTELALDLRSCWNHAADELWGQLEPELWELTSNPWVVLQTVSKLRLAEVLARPAFQARVQELVRAQKEKESGPNWFDRQYGKSVLSSVAYFSMEFLLAESLPIYSGGLGNVAGDQLKAAEDLGVPVIGVGLLYQQGYFRQFIDSNGAQQCLFPYNDPGQLPIAPLRREDGEWLRVQVLLPGLKLWLRAWQVKVGRRKLYLLDSNDTANLPECRGITSELYGGGPELRLTQELVLGIGGWRLLRALNLHPEVCHLNEGHTAFAILERAHAYMLDHGQPFDVALAVTRAGNVFTTHTPVEAGFDRFAPELIRKYLSFYAAERLHIPVGDLLALGRRNRNDASEPFNMAYLAMRGSNAVNGVSRLHGEVSRRIFLPLYQRWPQADVPVGHITNGVHTPTWDSAAADTLWTEACGKERWSWEQERVAADFRRMEEERLWEMRGAARLSMIHYVRKQLPRQLAREGASLAEISAAAHIFDPNALTLGFARRFATYKRPNLLLYDRERFARILRNPQRPVQLVLAGKAHPQDQAGQGLIQEWNRFIRRPDIRPHVVFLADYDARLAEHLVQGTDLWINTPRRPWEASGTSGMKVLVNGGLNLSELDGWWAEAYAPEVGWSLGDGQEHGDDPSHDAAEAEQLYDVLEREVIPAFYQRDERGVPAGWVARIRESMARLTPAFSANRAVREYTEKHYLRAAQAYQDRLRDNGRLGVELVAWRQQLAHHWDSVRFGSLQVRNDGGQWLFEVQVYLDALDPDAVSVELYADARQGEEPVRQPMQRAAPLAGAANGFAYSARVAANRPAADFTPRLIPHHPAALVPLEAAHILWQR